MLVIYVNMRCSTMSNLSCHFFTQVQIAHLSVSGFRQSCSPFGVKMPSAMESSWSGVGGTASAMVGAALASRGREPRTAGGKYIVLLSLFDGSGIARLGLDDLLRMAEAQYSLVGSFFAEVNDTLARAVEERWRAHAALGLGPPHLRVAADVWDMLRGTAEPLRRVLDAAPRGALLLVIAGSPCQQLTVAGRWRGRQGLAGPDSVNFFAVPAVTGAVRRLRPDLTVTALLENAGSTLRSHRVAMGEAFGLDEAATAAYGPVVDAGDWNRLPRRRLLLATVPPDPQPWNPPRRPTPWRPGWGPHWQGTMKPLMRAQSQMGDYIHGRSFQYAARSLLYYDGAPWQLMTLRGVVSRIGALLPTELREG